MKMKMQFSYSGTSYNAIYGWSGGKYPETGPPGPMQTDPGDYCSGLGVFMRYLYYCCQDNNIRAPITHDPSYMQIIYDTADACFVDGYPRIDDEVHMFRQFNRLASLLATLRIISS